MGSECGKVFPKAPNRRVSTKVEVGVDEEMHWRPAKTEISTKLLKARMLVTVEPRKQRWHTFISTGPRGEGECEFQASALRTTALQLLLPTIYFPVPAFTK